jgi:pentatricopeptide repeat protein
MLPTGIQPNEFTCASVLPACANLGALGHGMEIHGCIIRNEIQCDGFVANALIDMYTKCGCVEKARDLFDKMHK